MTYREDIIKEYAEGRKNLTEEEADEVLTAALKYLKLCMKSNSNYAIKLPYLGFMYRDYSKDTKLTSGMNTVTVKEEAFVSACYNVKRGKLIGFSNNIMDTEYKGYDYTDLMRRQNNYEDI